MSEDRALPSAFTDRIRAATLQPVWLVEIWKGRTAGAGILRYASAERDIVFPAGGDTYAARAFSLGEVSIDDEAGGEIAIEVADADGALKALTNAWEGNPVILRLVMRDLLGSATYAQEDRFVIESVEPRPVTLVFQVRPRLSLLERDAPRRRVSARDFPGLLDL